MHRRLFVSRRCLRKVAFHPIAATHTGARIRFIMKPPTAFRPEIRDIQRLVSDRTLELAKLAGRAPHQIRQADYERAKREIAGANVSGTL